MSADDTPQKIHIEDINRLRGELVRFAMNHSCSREDAEDLAAEVLVACFRNNVFDRMSYPDARSYAFKAMNGKLVDHWRTPYRVLMKRLDIVVDRQIAGDRNLLEWKVGERIVIGLNSQSKMSPITWEDLCERMHQLATFLYAPSSLGGDDPSQLTMRTLTVAFLKWIGKPIYRDELVRTLAQFVVITGDEVQPDGEFDPPAPMQDVTLTAWSLVNAVLTLPQRWRAAFLLTMNEPVLVMIYGKLFREELVKLLAPWTPPPSLEKDELPISASVLSKKYEMSEGAFAVDKSRAKAEVKRLLSIL